MREKTYHSGFLKVFLVGCLSGFSSLAHAGGVLSSGSAPILPPVQMSIVGQSMGGAVVGDGTLYNATSFNPALLGQAPGTLELLQLGANISNDTLLEVNNISSFNFDSLGSVQDILQGAASNSSSEVNQGLRPLDSFSSTFVNQTLQVGLSDNFAVKVTDNFGIEVYNNSQLITEVLPGSVLSSLTNVPINGNSVNGIGSSVNVFQSGIQTTVNQFIPLAQQTGAIATDIANLKAGGGSAGSLSAAEQKFAADAQINQTSFTNAITNTLLKDLIYINALAYSDTVAMATINFNPFEDFPLTVGINGKVVRRYFTWAAALAPSTNIIDQGSNIGNDFLQPTTRWGMDLGFLYAMEPNLNLGLSFEDLLASSATIPNASVATDILYGVVTDPAPTVTRVGLSWHPIHELSLDGDIDDVFSTTSYYTGLDFFSHFKAGAALSLAGILQLRGGFSDGNFDGGLGLQLGFVGLDYSYAIDDLSYTYDHYAQLKIVF